MLRPKVAVALLLALPLAGQTFVVDAANGPGAQFTSIAAAIPAVPGGAVLVVRAGTYAGFQIAGKSLTILGDPGVTVSSLGAQPIVITNLNVAQSVAIRGIVWSNPLGPATLSCQNCAGLILIDNCRADLTVPGGGGCISALACSNVQVVTTSLHCVGRTALDLQASSAACSSCSFSGTPVASVTNGRLHLSACTVQGGFGAPLLVALQSSSLVVTGSTSFGGWGNTLVAGGSGTAALDPSTSFTGIAASIVAAAVQLQNRAIPWLSASTSSLGGAASATMTVRAGSLGLLLAGLPEQPIALPAIADPAWIAPGAAVLVALGAPPSATAGYTVPNQARFLGARICWQGVEHDLTAGSVRLSNPVAYVHW